MPFGAYQSLILSLANNLLTYTTTTFEIKQKHMLNTCFLINVWSSAIWASIFGEVKWTKVRPVENPPWNTIISIDLWSFLILSGCPIKFNPWKIISKNSPPHHFHCHKKSPCKKRTSRISHSKQKVLWGKPTQCRFLFLQKRIYPKNHGIWKLVVWRSQNPAIFRVKPLLFGGSKWFLGYYIITSNIPVGNLHPYVDLCCEQNVDAKCKHSQLTHKPWEPQAHSSLFKSTYTVSPPWWHKHPSPPCLWSLRRVSVWSNHSRTAPHSLDIEPRLPVTGFQESCKWHGGYEIAEFKLDFNWMTSVFKIKLPIWQYSSSASGDLMNSKSWVHSDIWCWTPNSNLLIGSVQ